MAKFLATHWKMPYRIALLLISLLGLSVPGLAQHPAFLASDLVPPEGIYKVIHGFALVNDPADMMHLVPLQDREQDFVEWDLSQIPFTTLVDSFVTIVDRGYAGQELGDVMGDLPGADLSQCDGANVVRVDLLYLSNTFDVLTTVPGLSVTYLIASFDRLDQEGLHFVCDFLILQTDGALHFEIWKHFHDDLIPAVIDINTEYEQPLLIEIFSSATGETRFEEIAGGMVRIETDRYGKLITPADTSVAYRTCERLAPLPLRCDSQATFSTGAGRSIQWDAKPIPTDDINGFRTIDAWSTGSSSVPGHGPTAVTIGSTTYRSRDWRLPRVPPTERLTFRRQLYWSGLVSTRRLGITSRSTST
jgi:hypothetical protein